MWESNVWNNGHSASTHWPPWRRTYNSPRVPAFQSIIIHYEWKVIWRLTVHSRTTGKWNQCWQVDCFVRNPKFSEEVPALSDDIVGFIAKCIAKYCDSMSVVVWSDHRCDWMIFHGHLKYRSGEAWNDWAMIKWQTTVIANDGFVYWYWNSLWRSNL